MKQFTIKDFIKYNGPCKSCSSKVKFRLMFQDAYEAKGSNVLIPTIEDNRLHFNFPKYKNNLLLIIEPKTNKISIHSMNEGSNLAFNELITKNQFYIDLMCESCGTTISTQFLEFEDNRIKPLELFMELVYVDTPTHSFRLHTSYTKNNSVFAVDINGKGSRNVLNTEIPILPLSKFKNREALLKKLYMLLAFS